MLILPTIAIPAMVASANSGPATLLATTFKRMPEILASPCLKSEGSPPDIISQRYLNANGFLLRVIFILPALLVVRRRMIKLMSWPEIVAIAAPIIPSLNVNIKSGSSPIFITAPAIIPNIAVLALP